MAEMKRWALVLVGLSQCLAACAGAARTDQPDIPDVNPDLVTESIQRYLSASKEPDSTGTGAFRPLKLEEASLPNHVVYRPADLAALGATKLPVYIYGNGACSEDGASQRQHLLEIASHGYLAIAAGRIYSGPGVNVDADDWAKHRDKTPYTLLGDAIDWAFAENQRAGSPYHGRIDTAHIAVSGYSCGGAQALRYAGDPRVGTFVILNAGLSEPDAPRTGEMDVSPTQLDRITVPVLYVLGGPRDIAHNNGMADYRHLVDIPAVALNIDVTHQGTFGEPNGGPVAAAVVAWLQWQFRGDTAAKGWFVGESCRLCRASEWSIERRNLDQVGAGNVRH